MMKSKAKKYGLSAIGQITQSIPNVAVDLTGVSNRVATLEGQNLNARIATLEAQIATLLSHTHTYEDDNGTTVETKSTSEPA